MLSYLGYGVLWVWVRVFGRLPLRVLYALADAVGGLAWYASPRLRRVTLGHVERVRRSSAALEAGALDPTAGSRGAGSRAAGNRAAGSNARAARGCVRSAARYWADMARAAHLPATAVLDRIESIEGVEHFFEALDAGCGVVLVSAHLGNPEALSRAIGTLGLDVLVLTEPLSPPRLHALLHEVRQAAGARFVPADRAGVRLAIEQLRAGRILGVLADRDVLGTAQPRPFFGAPARLPSGAVELALRTNARIVTGFARRAAGGRVRVTLDAPIELQRSGDRAADLEAGMERVTRALEAGIGQSPEQWFALQPVWDDEGS